MQVPQDQWEGLVGKEPHPHGMYFAVGRGGVSKKPYFTFDFRLDGCSMRELAKALAFFFVMDDYGQMLYGKVLKESDTLLQAWEKMKRLAWGGDYAEWKEEQQQMFVKFCKDVEEFEEEKVRQQDGDSSA